MIGTKPLYIILGIILYLIFTVNQSKEQFEDEVVIDMKQIASRLSQIPSTNNSVLISSQALYIDELIVSPNGEWSLTFKSDGQLWVENKTTRESRSVGPIKGKTVDYRPGFCLLTLTGEIIFTSSNNYSQPRINNSPLVRTNICVPVWSLGSNARTYNATRVQINNEGGVYCQNELGNLLWYWNEDHVSSKEDLTSNISNMSSAIEMAEKLSKIINGYNLTKYNNYLKMFSIYDDNLVKINIKTPVNTHISRISFKYNEEDRGITQLMNPTIGYKTIEKDFNVFKAFDNPPQDNIIGDASKFTKTMGIDCEDNYLNKMEFAITHNNDIATNYVCINRNKITKSDNMIPTDKKLLFNPTSTTPYSCMCGPQEYITDIDIVRKGDKLTVKNSCKPIPSPEEVQKLQFVPTHVDTTKSAFVKQV